MGRRKLTIPEKAKSQVIRIDHLKLHMHRYYQNEIKEAVASERLKMTREPRVRDVLLMTALFRNFLRTENLNQKNSFTKGTIILLVASLEKTTMTEIVNFNVQQEKNRVNFIHMCYALCEEGYMTRFQVVEHHGHPFYYVPTAKANALLKRFEEYIKKNFNRLHNEYERKR